MFSSLDWIFQKNLLYSLLLYAFVYFYKQSELWTKEFYNNEVL